MMLAEHQQVDLEPARLGQHLFGRLAPADPGFQRVVATRLQAPLQMVAGPLFLDGTSLLGEHVQQAQPRLALPGQLGGPVQGQVGFGAEVVGDEDMLNHGDLERETEAKYAAPAAACPAGVPRPSGRECRTSRVRRGRRGSDFRSSAHARAFFDRVLPLCWPPSSRSEQ